MPSFNSRTTAHAPFLPVSRGPVSDITSYRLLHGSHFMAPLLTIYICYSVNLNW